MNQTSEANEPNLVHEDSPAESVERKFFVANLGYDIGESDLYSFFSTYGKVEQVRLIVDRITGSSRGFGFITMADEVGALSVADLAEESNNTVTMMGRPGVHIAVHDRERQIRKAEERRQMFGGGGGFGPYGGGDSSCMPPYHLHHHHNHPSNHPGIGMPPPAPYGGFQPSISLPPHHARAQMPPPPPPLSSSYTPVPPAWHKMRVSIGGGAGGSPFELLVEDLPNNISIYDLVAKFSSYGTVIGASMRQSIGDAGSGRPSYGRVRFSNPTSLAAAVTGHIPTAPHHHQHQGQSQGQSQNQLRSLRESNTATGTTTAPGPNDYGLWRPHPKTVPTVPTPASAPTPTLQTDSIEGSLSTWSGSAGNGGPFTPPRIGRNGRGPRPPGF